MLYSIFSSERCSFFVAQNLPIRRHRFYQLISSIFLFCRTKPPNLSLQYIQNMFLFCRLTPFFLFFESKFSLHLPATYRELSTSFHLLLFFFLFVYQLFTFFVFYQFFILTQFFTFLSPNYFNLALNLPINQ